MIEVYRVSTEEEKEFKRVFKTSITPKEWVSQNGHRILNGDFRNCIFSDREFQNWLHEVYRLLHESSREDRDRSF